MRKLFAATLLGIAVITAGCSGCSILSNDHALLASTLTDEKALYACEAAMYGADAAAGAAVDAGLLKPGSPEALKVADGLDEAHKALEAARSAYKVGDAVATGDRITAAQAFIAQAWALIPQKKG